jgi:hypothetical protein
MEAQWPRKADLVILEHLLDLERGTGNGNSIFEQLLWRFAAHFGASPLPAVLQLNIVRLWNEDYATR